MAELRVIERGYKSDVVQILEQLLVEARDGKIMSIVVTTEQGGGYTTDYSGCEDLGRLIGHLERQKHLMLRRMDV